MRLKIIGNEIIKNVGKSQSCMVSKLPSNSNSGRASSGHSPGATAAPLVGSLQAAPEGEGGGAEGSGSESEEVLPAPNSSLFSKTCTWYVLMGLL